MFTNNKKTTESGVAPAGIKSHKILFELEKNQFCSIQKIEGLVCKKNGQSRKLECLYQGYGILDEDWVTDSQCHSVLGSTVSGES